MFFNIFFSVLMLMERSVSIDKCIEHTTCNLALGLNIGIISQSKIYS